MKRTQETMKSATYIHAPLEDEVLEKLHAGDKVLISGIIYSARDSAHRRLVELINERKPLPIDLRGQIIYYMGPAPPKPGMAIGSSGPTSSYRMDPYTPVLISEGLKGMIGKGPRGAEVKKAMKEQRAVYFAATGGTGALISKTIKRVEVVAYEDLGPEAIRRIDVRDFPAIVVNDVKGNDLYDEGKKKYRKI